MNNLSDNEIIKALECCRKPVGQACKECPLNSKGVDCLDFDIDELVLDLINRQKAEIERLNNLCFCLSNERDAYKEVLDTSVAEAVKECIEKIKTRSSSCVASKDGIVIAGSRTYTISEVELYEIEKEMVGEG